MRSVLIDLVLVLLAGFCLYAATVGDVDIHDAVDFLHDAGMWLKTKILK